MQRWLKLLVMSGLVTVHTASAQSNCQDSPDDDQNIEYFNLTLGSPDVNYSVVITDTGTAMTVKLKCPEITPPASFDAVISEHGGAGLSCYDPGVLTIEKATLTANSLPFCDAQLNCDFHIRAVNKTEHVVYSDTPVSVSLQPGNNQISPALNPGDLPICDSSIDTCLSDQNCQFSNEPPEPPEDVLVCETPSSCALQPAYTGHGFNTNVYQGSFW